MSTIPTACQTTIDRPLAVAPNRLEPAECLPTVAVTGTLII